MSRVNTNREKKLNTTQKKINENESWFFEKTYKPLARQINKQTEKRYKLAITGMREVKITMHSTDIKNIIGIL